MALKFNEGDVMEGIFAVAVGLYLKDGKVDKQALNKIRTQINPAKFADGKENIVIIKNRLNKLDRVSISVSIKLKAKSTAAAFGEDYLPLYTKDSDIGYIDQKINTLINSITSTNFGRAILKAKDNFINNSRAEYIDLFVENDGIEGERSGGLLKGDVSVKLYAFEKANKKKAIGTFNTNYSLKSGSTTVASLSPLNGIKKIYESLGGDVKVFKDYEEALHITPKTPSERTAISEIIINMYKELGKQLVELYNKNHYQFSQAAIDFLIINMHGTDMASIIDIRKSSIKEMNSDYLETMKTIKSLAFKPVVVPNLKNVIRFINADNPTDTTLANTLFQLRLKINTTSSGTSERKFMIELGKLASPLPAKWGFIQMIVSRLIALIIYILTIPALLIIYSIQKINYEDVFETKISALGISYLYFRINKNTRFDSFLRASSLYKLPLIFSIIEGKLQWFGVRIRSHNELESLPFSFDTSLLIAKYYSVLPGFFNLFNDDYNLQLDIAYIDNVPHLPLNKKLALFVIMWFTSICNINIPFNFYYRAT